MIATGGESIEKLLQFSVFKMNHNAPYSLVDIKTYRRRIGEDKNIRGIYIKSEN
jgi:hypothetical protein